MTATEHEPDLHDLRPVKEAAEALDVTTRSVYNWIKAGILTEYKTPGGGKRLVDVAELRRKLRP